MELTSVRAPLAISTEQAKAGHYALAALIGELEVAAATRIRDLGVAGRAVRSLKGRISVHEDSVDTVEAWAAGTLDEMF